MRIRNDFWKYGLTAAVSVALSFALFLVSIPYLPLNVSSPYVFEQVSKADRNPIAVTDIARKVGPAIVGITTKQQTTGVWGQKFESEGSGSGIIFRADGYIVTNYHVIEGASTLTVILNTGEEFSAKVVGQDSKTDLAVVKIDKNDLPTAEFGISSELEVGELMVAIGNPLGSELAGTLTVGYVSALNRSVEVDGRIYSLIQTDAAINPGNSGGALVNEEGLVVGINSVKAASAEGIGFAIPVDTAKPIIDELIAHGYVTGRPVIGFSARAEIDKSLSERYNIPIGIYVGEVQLASAAETAGMKAQDVIQKADGEDCLTMAKLEQIKIKYKPGDNLVLEGKRKNQSSGKWEDIKWTVKLGEEKHE